MPLVPGDIPYKDIIENNQVKDDLLFKLKQLDILLTSQGESLELYLIGGSACILGGFIERTTLDMDIIDIDYPSRAGRFLNILEPFDLLEFSHTSVPASYKKRAHAISGFECLRCFFLSPEDLIVSKLCRFADKDVNDIERLLKFADINRILDLIAEVISDSLNRMPGIAAEFLKNSKEFIRRYGSVV